jgi:hypothetical protein
VACAGAKPPSPGAAAGGGTGAASEASTIPGPLGASNMSQPDGDSTGWVTRRTSPFSVTTRLSTATYAVNRHSTPYRSEVATMVCSSSVRPARYRSSSSRSRARAHCAVTAGSALSRTGICRTKSSSSRVRPRTVSVPPAVPV